MKKQDIIRQARTIPIEQRGTSSANMITSNSKEKQAKEIFEQFLESNLKKGRRMDMIIILISIPRFKQIKYLFIGYLC